MKASKKKQKLRLINYENARVASKENLKKSCLLGVYCGASCIKSIKYPLIKGLLPLPVPLMVACVAQKCLAHTHDKAE